MRPQGAKLNVINLTISSNTDTYNIYNSAPSNERSRRAIVILTINSGIWLYSSVAGTPALDTGTGWVTGTVIKVVNNGYIHGMGGAGGAGASGYQPYVGDMAGAAGGNGGNAINLQWALTINNASGRIAGGGGGGGGGGGLPSGSYPNWDNFIYANGGGGGGGQSGPAGSFGGGITGQASGVYDPSAGADGTTAGAGNGGIGGLNGFVGYGGDGGNGGGWGADGSSGAGTAQASASSGGSAGKAVKLNGYVLTWESLGTVYGSYT